MSGTSRKTRIVTIRLSNEAWDKIQKALEWPSCNAASVGEYCKQVMERHVFRHSKRKYRKYNSRKDRGYGPMPKMPGKIVKGD